MYNTRNVSRYFLWRVEKRTIWINALKESDRGLSISVYYKTKAPPPPPSDFSDYFWYTKPQKMLLRQGGSESLPDLPNDGARVKLGAKITCFMFLALIIIILIIIVICISSSRSNTNTRTKQINTYVLKLSGCRNVYRLITLTTNIVSKYNWKWSFALKKYIYYNTESQNKLYKCCYLLDLPTTMVSNCWYLAQFLTLQTDQI